MQGGPIVKRRNRKIGLALGGGGARGGLHIGVLKILEAHRIPVHCIAGTSIGALIGAAYVQKPNARKIEKRLFEYLQSDLFQHARFRLLCSPSSQEPKLFGRISSFIKKEYLLNITLARPYIYSRIRFLKHLKYFLADAKIEDMRIPFAAVASDLETGEEVILNRGSLLKAVYASSTYPGVVEAVRLDGRLLIDGGITALVPVEATRRLGADVVIAVNPEPRIDAKIEDPSGLEIIFRADDIMMAELTAWKSRNADVMIFPRKGDAKWYEFSKTPEYIRIGEKAAREKMPKILKAIGR
jgi:NTE family protein